MTKYIIRRVLTLIPTLLVISFMVFGMMSMTGDPATTIAGPTATESEIEAIRESLGLNEPLVVRYFDYMSGLLQGDFGVDLYGNSVWDSFAAKIPYTIILSVVATVLTIVIALTLGIISAVKQNTWTDTGLSAFAIAGLSIPQFWLGLLMMVLFSVQLGWLPTSGAQGFKSVIMPGICTAVANIALMTRMTRSSMIDQLRADYLRTARAKGVSERKVITKHALGNGLIPIITIFGSQFGALIGGAVVIETVFAWPGVGFFIVSSIRSNDFQVVTGFIILITLMVALVLMAVDILYAYVDPRIKARYAGK